MTKFLKWILIPGFTICILFFSIYFCPRLTPEESYFFKILQVKHKQSQFEVPIEESTQFKWEEAIWLGSYSGIDPKVQIGEEIHSLSKYNLDLQNDGAWALVFINGDQIVTVIQGKLSKLFGKYRYLSFFRKNPPDSKRYYPDDIIKMSEKFEFTIIRGSK